MKNVSVYLLNKVMKLVAALLITTFLLALFREVDLLPPLRVMPERPALRH
jgi:hypothetical protein